jgi:iron complex transport system substrate-binding protein
MRTNPSRALVVLAVLAVVAAGVGPVGVEADGAAAAVASSGPTPAGISAVGTGGALAQGNCSYPVTVTDGSGTAVTLDEAPERVVALQASAAQIMWAIGAEERVVGMPVQPYTSYLDGSANRTNVVNADGTVNVEQVVGLDPGLVIAPDIIPNSTVQTLRDAGLTVYNSGFPSSIRGIYAKTGTIGRLVGACGAANETVTEMRGRVSAIEGAVAGADRPSVLYYSFNFTAGNGTFVGEGIETAAGVDAVAFVTPPNGHFFVLSDEVVANRTIEWIVQPSGSTIPDREPFTNTVAVQGNQTITVDANYISQPAPRMVLPLTELARTFHPAAMAEANLSALGFLADATNATTIGATDRAGADGAGAGGTATEAPIAADGGNATVTADTTATADAMTDTAAATEVAETTATAAATGEGDADGGAGTTESGTGTTAGDGPGFGVALALVAVLAAGLLARRRG